jgi:hypothetical protein
LGTRIAEVLFDLRLQPPEPAAGAELQQVEVEQVDRAVEVAVDEVVAFQLPHPAGEVDEAQVAVGLPVTADPGDLGGHPGGVGDHVEGRAVRVVGPVRRVQRDQFQPVPQLLADRAERLGDQTGHGQHRGAGVELVPAEAVAAGPAAGPGLAFDDGHLAAAAGQV